MDFALGFAAGTVFWLGALGMAVALAVHEPPDTDELQDVWTD